MKLTLDILRRAKVAINLPELNILDGLKIPFRPGESDLHTGLVGLAGSADTRVVS